MILSCQNICKSFGEKVVLQDASFHIEDREKAALIGNNGAGKTTLLRIIMHELSPDSGNVVLAKDKNIGYLAQYQDIHGHHTIYEELISTKQHIIDSAYDPAFGARPLRRYLQHTVETLISRKIISGEVEPGDTLVVDCAGDELTVSAVQVQ